MNHNILCKEERTVSTSQLRWCAVWPCVFLGTVEVRLSSSSAGMPVRLTGSFLISWSGTWTLRSISKKNQANTQYYLLEPLKITLVNISNCFINIFQSSYLEFFCLVSHYQYDFWPFWECFFCFWESQSNVDLMTRKHRKDIQTLRRKNLGWDKIVLNTGTIGICTDCTYTNTGTDCTCYLLLAM